MIQNNKMPANEQSLKKCIWTKIAYLFVYSLYHFNCLFSLLSLITFQIYFIFLLSQLWFVVVDLVCTMCMCNVNAVSKSKFIKHFGRHQVQPVDQFFVQCRIVLPARRLHITSNSFFLCIASLVIVWRLSQHGIAHCVNTCMAFQSWCILNATPVGFRFDQLLTHIEKSIVFQLKLSFLTRHIA